jgi:hypothetical protein
MELAGGAIVALLILAGFGVLGALALCLGVDSRPTIDDEDQRPWLVPGR